MPKEAPHIDKSHEPAAAHSDQITNSPVEAKKRSYENDGGLSARRTKKVTTPNSAEASATDNGRYPRPMKLSKKPATRNASASAPKEMAVSASRESVVAAPSQVARPYCKPAARTKRTKAAAMTLRFNGPPRA